MTNAISWAKRFFRVLRSFVKLDCVKSRRSWSSRRALSLFRSVFPNCCGRSFPVFFEVSTLSCLKWSEPISMEFLDDASSSSPFLGRFTSSLILALVRPSGGGKQFCESQLLHPKDERRRAKLVVTGSSCFFIGTIDRGNNINGFFPTIYRFFLWNEPTIFLEQRFHELVFLVVKKT